MFFILQEGMQWFKTLAKPKPNMDKHNIFSFISFLGIISCFSKFLITYSEAIPIPPATPDTDLNLSQSSCCCDNNNEKPDPERFSKLKLRLRELHGSRWSLEQNTTINVSHSIDISDATLVHDNQLTLRVEFNLRQSWIATGLELPPGLFKDTDGPRTFISSDDKVLKHMWSPMSFISTSRESNMNTQGTPLSLVYIYKNRTIIFKVRMFTKVACTSDFQWYPVDVQTCNLTIASYKYLDTTVLYHWTDDRLYRPVIHEIKRPMQYELRVPLKLDSGTIERGGRGKRFAYVSVIFTFERKLGNNIIQVYTPTILVVVLSWFSFWLGLDCSPGRISLLVTCMLTLVTMHSGIKSSIPPVHYVTMMDVWMVCCMGMVFSAMCEFVVIKYFHWRQHQKQKEAEKLKEMQTKDALLDFLEKLQIRIENGDKIGAAGDRLKTLPIAWNDKFETDLKTGGNLEGTPKTEVPFWMNFDKICRGLFPFLFAIFNVIYWSVLLNEDMSS